MVYALLVRADDRGSSLLVELGVGEGALVIAQAVVANCQQLQL